MPLMAACNSIQGQRWPNRSAFIEAITGFSPCEFNLRILQNSVVGRPGTRHKSSFLSAPLPHIIVKTWDGHATLLIVQAGDHLAQGLQRVEYRPAEIAGMRVVRRSLHFQFGPQAAPLRVTDRRTIGSEHASIRDDGCIGSKCVFVSHDELR